MSILQEFEFVRGELGPAKYQAVEEFIFDFPEYLLSDVYYNSEVNGIFEKWYAEKLASGYVFDATNRPDPEMAKQRRTADQSFDHYLICTRLADTEPEMESAASGAAAVLYFASSLGIYNERQHAALLKKLHRVMCENPNYKVYPEGEENED